MTQRASPNKPIKSRSNDNLVPVGNTTFFGGMSVDSNLGTDGQFYYGQHLDFRKNPSSFSILPGTARTDAGIVTDLVQAMDQITSGVRYALGDAGNVYKVATNGLWSKVVALGENGGAGLVYRSDLDMVYFSGQSKLGRIRRVSTLNTIQEDFFKNGISTSTTCSKTGGTNTYTVPSSITETAPNMRAFTSDIEPLYQLGVKITAKGTGDWTLTLHDDANTNLGSVTITNANIVNGQINYFIFSPPVRIQRGDLGAGSALTYHFHLTSTISDGTVATTTANSLADCDMELWANALVSTQNALHPMINFVQYTLIGNGRYVAAYEPLQDNPTTADFNRHQLTFPPGFEVCGFAQKNLMVVIGCEKRSASGDFQEGALFFWDGTADTYNDWWPVPEGAPESLYSNANTVFFTASGALYQILSSDQPIKIRTIRNTSSEYSGVTDTTHAYPNMMTVRRGVMLVGYPGVTTNQSLEHGVYSYGSISREYPMSWGYSYTTSNGNILNNGSNNLRIGMVQNYGDTLYISWRDDSVAPQTYGVDIVNNSSAPASTFTITNLVFDNQQPHKYKNSAYILCTFDPWPDGATLTLRYKIDGDSAYTYSTQTPARGDLYVLLPVDRRFLNLTYGADGTCGATTPSINSLQAFIDPLPGERPIGG